LKRILLLIILNNVRMNILVAHLNILWQVPPHEN
jgi:hypothetical protein